MSTIIQIKRSANVAAPTTTDLLEGELAYSYDKSNSGVGAKLYIEALDAGNNEVIHAVGGKYYTDTVDAATASNTASAIVKRDANGDFSARDITARNFYGNITGTIQGQAASAVVANTANALTTGRYIVLSGDVAGSAYFDGTGNAEISATVIQTNSVALGTDTTGDYVANLTQGTGISITGGTGETSTPTIALATSGVSAGTYGGATTIPVVVFDTYGRATSASNVSLAAYITASSTDTLLNKTFDTSNNTLRIQGNQVSSYTGSGSSVVLSQSPTISVLNISDSQINLDGGSGSYYWSGQSGVAQAGDLKAGVYASDPSSNNSLFTFGTNGSNKMSVGVEGSLFVGTAMPSNNGGLSTAYSGWLVVQAGGKFGGDIDTLGGLNLTDATSGKIQFSDGTIQRTAYTSNHLTTANVVELTNLYFTNTRARAALTGVNGISYDSGSGNIALSTSGVSASTYGGASKIPVITVDTYGRITSAANVAVAGVSSFSATGNVFTISTADGGSFSASIQPNSVRLGTDTTGDYVKNVLSSTGIVVTGTPGETRDVTVALDNTAVTPGTYGGVTAIPTFTVDQQGRLTSAGNVSVSTSFTLSDGTNTDTFNNGDVFRILAGTGVSSTLTDNTFTITNTGVTNLSSGGYGISVSGSTGSVSVSNTGVTRAIAGTGISVDANNGNVTFTNTGVTSITGTANEVEVSASTGSITIGLPNNVTIGNNLSVTGNLYVTGNVVALPVETLVVNDPLIQLANTNTATDIVDIGFYGSYGTGGPHEHAGLFRDASDGKFKLFTGLIGNENVTSTVNIAAAGYKVATLVADLLASNANVTTALTFGNENHKILPLNSSVLEVRGGVGDSNGALSLAAGNYPTSYSKIYLESAKKITAQADEFYVTLFNDGSTKLITMNTTHTVATSNTNGALRVAGGAGFTGAVYAASFHGYIDGGTY